MKLIALCLILTACYAPPRYSLQVRQTLLHGSDAAIMQGCVRGVIRWHHIHTGAYPALVDVGILCEDVRRSFQDEIGEDLGNT